MIRFQKVWVFLISTRRDLSIALCFGSKNSNVYFFGSDENSKNKNFKKSKIFQIFIGTKKSIHLNFWSQNIAQSRDLVEQILKTPKLFENGPVVTELWSLENGGKSQKKMGGVKKILLCRNLLSVQQVKSCDKLDNGHD